MVRQRFMYWLLLSNEPQRGANNFARPHLHSCPSLSFFLFRSAS